LPQRLGKAQPEVGRPQEAKVAHLPQTWPGPRPRERAAADDDPVHAWTGLLEPLGGVGSRREILGLAGRRALDHAVRTGHLVRVHPHVYTPRDTPLEPRTVRLRASLRYVDDVGSLSHLTALDLWSLPTPDGGPVHLVVPARVQRTSTASLQVHRRTRFSAAEDQRMRQGYPVTSLERAVVDSWPLLEGESARAPALVAVRERRTTGQRLWDEATRRPNLKGRASLLAFLDRLRAGCHSELELLGHQWVLDHPSMPQGRAQHKVELSPGVAYLDWAYEAEMVGVELDGERYHRGRQARERDMRRDARLAALGWLVLRFSGRRLRTDPHGVRREITDVLDRRRRQLRSA
jgi:hypothetical protein